MSIWQISLKGVESVITIIMKMLLHNTPKELSLCCFGLWPVLHMLLQWLFSYLLCPFQVHLGRYRGQNKPKGLL
jgi:hypothetical protein